MEIKEPTRKHPEIKELTNLLTKKRSRFETLYLTLGLLTIVLCCYYSIREVPNKPAVSEKRVATSSRRQETPPRDERPAVPVVEEETTEAKSKSVESFPIEEMKVLKDSSSVWSLVGTVRNNTEHPVRGIVIIRFLDKTGHVFHESQNIVAGPKGITAIQTGEIPLLPEPEWIRPGEFGWFIHPEDYIVFEEAADIEVTFKKISK